MGVTKRIVCLANSRKLSGRCVAGKELLDGGSWIRPVSGRTHQEVSKRERQYRDGSDPCVLDVIDIPLLKPVPVTYQQENWLLDSRSRWAKAGSLGWEDLAGLEDPSGPLWINGQSSVLGRNDRIDSASASGLQSSLRLIQVPGVRLMVSVHRQASGGDQRRVRAEFTYAKVMYRLRVTDPVYENRLNSVPNGHYQQLGECFLTISLGEPFNNAVYKLVAAIIEPTSTSGGVQS